MLEIVIWGSLAWLVVAFVKMSLEEGKKEDERIAKRVKQQARNDRRQKLIDSLNDEIDRLGM